MPRATRSLSGELVAELLGQPPRANAPAFRCPVASLVHRCPGAKQFLELPEGACLHDTSQPHSEEHGKTTWPSLPFSRQDSPESDVSTSIGSDSSTGVSSDSPSAVARARSPRGELIQQLRSATSSSSRDSSADSASASGVLDSSSRSPKRTPLIQQLRALVDADCAENLSPTTPGLDFPRKSLENSGYAFVKDIVQVTQGVIKLAEHTVTGSFRCVKCFDKSKMHPETLEQMEAEVELMFQFGEHPNIGNAFEVFQDASAYYLAQPYYSGGNLVNLNRRALGAGVVPIHDWWTRIVRQCLTGLAHMHAQNVMHCDIKEQNIMLKGDDLWEPEVIIIDLGVAQRTGTQRSIIYGTPGYIPPEVWAAKNWQPQSDMFSLGVVIVQMLIGKVGIFTSDTSSYKEIEQATRWRVPPFELMPTEFPSLRELARKLLAKDVDARPSAASILQEPLSAAIMPLRPSLADLDPQETDVKLHRRHTVHSHPTGAQLRRFTPVVEHTSRAASRSSSSAVLPPLMSARGIPRGCASPPHPPPAFAAPPLVSLKGPIAARRSIGVARSPDCRRRFSLVA